MPWSNPDRDAIISVEANYPTQAPAVASDDDEMHSSIGKLAGELFTDATTGSRNQGGHTGFDHYVVAGHDGRFLLSATDTRPGVAPEGVRPPIYLAACAPLAAAG
jgi:hypothetical protein